MKNSILVGLFIFFGTSSSAAQTPGNVAKDSYPAFIENKGQVVDQNNKPNSAVLYLLNTPGMNVQLRSGGFSYDVYSVTNSKVKSQKSKLQLKYQNDTDSNDFPASPFHDIATSGHDSESIINFHRIDILLEGANTECIIIPSDPAPDFLNYYNANTPVAGNTNVRQYRTITFKNIYPNIDLEFLSNEDEGFKYNFVIHPGGKIHDLKLKINGPDQITWTPDTLTFRTRLGDVCELIPESYIQASSSRSAITTHFREIKHGIYGFSIDRQIRDNETLVIDPTSKRIWGTYYGGVQTEDGFCLSVDLNHNVYLTGTTESTINIATAGAYQSTKIGSQGNGFLVKFNASGVRQWGTYYGGDSSGIIIIRGSATDMSGNIYIVGLTDADSGIASPGAHQTIYGGGNWDAILAKFNTNGVRLWATYYGGEDHDEISYGPGVATDKYGNVYICGLTGSDSNISTPGSYQEFQYPPPNGQDAFMAKFDSNGVRQWGTYYGGNNLDLLASCACDTLGNLYAAGMTASTIGITSPGAYQTVFGGNPCDGFFVAFTPSGQRLWGTYLGGNSEDMAAICTADQNGSVYLGGYTASTNGISSTGSHQPALGGGLDGFIAKFSNLGQRIWSSYYGGTLDDYVIGCSISNNGDIFFTGDTQSPNGIATPNSFMPAYGGGFRDGYLVKFDLAGQRQWGTYFGNTGQDEAVSCRYIPDDTVYFAGRSSSANNISTPDAHQKFLAGWTDAILEKFIECWPIDTAGPITGIASVCVNTTGVSYSIPMIDHAVDYAWTLPAGATLVSGAGTTGIVVDFTNSAISGNIRVKGLNKCGDPGDSSFLYVTVHQRPVPVISGNDTTCSGPGKVYTTAPGKSNYQWSISPGGVITAGGDTTDNAVTVTWNSPGLQTVQVNYTDTSGCAALTPSLFNVFIIPGPPVSITINASANNVCAGTMVNFTATPVNGGVSPQYQWQVNGISVGTNNPSYSYIPVSLDLVSCILTSTDTCSSNNPDTSNTVTMIVNPLLPVSVTVAPSVNPACAGSPVTFTAFPTNGGSSPQYQWQVNGMNVGTNSPVYSYLPMNNDQVQIILISNEVCTTNNPDTSNIVMMTVNPLMPVSISIAASSNPFCPGSSVTFTAVPANGGTTPQYQWQVNGGNVGTNNPVYSYNPASLDLVSCILTSSEPCVTGNPATALPILMTASPNPPAGATIVASPNPFCPGSPVSFTATPVNGGSNPTYQWIVNGTNAGTNSPAFTYNPADNDSVRCVMTSNLACVSANPASSNTIIMSGSLAPVVTFTACFDTITTTNAKPIRLKGGIPLGGTYTGPGVSLNIFNPATAGPGTKTITYTYTNAALCSASATARIFNFPFSIFNCGNNLIDIRDNNVYPTVQIGSQCWFAANLDYGIQIPETAHQRDNCISEKYKSAVGSPQSAVYQWDEMMLYDNTPGLQCICPPGWHIPTEIDWNTLFANWTNNAFAAAPLKYSGYSGFNAFLLGARHQNVQWDYQNFATFFWSSTAYGPYKAWAHGMNDPDFSVSYYPSLRSNAFSVRCLRD